MIVTAMAIVMAEIIMNTKALKAVIVAMTGKKTASLTTTTTNSVMVMKLTMISTISTTTGITDFPLVALD